MIKKVMSLLVVGFALCSGFVVPASAASITFNASDGSLAASVLFNVSGTNLIVTLTNTSSADVLVPTDVLTAVFFSLEGNPSLTSVSAVLASGSTVAFGGTDPGNVVGGEWAYKRNLSGAPGDANSGISSSGLSPLFGAATFPGDNLQGTSALDGLQYGITSAGDNLATGNAAVNGGNALIKNSVVFTLGSLPQGFDPSQSISDVSFQYGTAITDPNIRPPQVPEPTSMLLLGFGLMGLAGARREFNK